MSSCQVCFLDCMGYWDMVSEITSLIILILVITKTLINIYNLHLLTQNTINKDQQLTKSHKRKLMVNIFSLIYQLSLFVTVMFSLMIFLIYMEDIREAGENKLNLWYKWSEIIFINLLNSLVLTVGLLYWKAVRLYYKLAQQSIPAIYNSWMKLVFALFYTINFSIVIISLVLLLATDETHYEQYEIKVINMANSIGVGCSTILCLVNRFLYQGKIINNMSMNKHLLKKENFFSMLIAFSGCCRLACMVLNLLGIDYAYQFRNFGSDCLDQTPYHAILMSLVTILINVVPPVIFSIIFSPITQSHKTHHHQINHYLCKDDQSVRYV